MSIWRPRFWRQLPHSNSCSNKQFGVFFCTSGSLNLIKSFSHINTWKLCWWMCSCSYFISKNAEALQLAGISSSNKPYLLSSPFCSFNCSSNMVELCLFPDSTSKFRGKWNTLTIAASTCSWFTCWMWFWAILHCTSHLRSICLKQRSVWVNCWV